METKRKVYVYERVPSKYLDASGKTDDIWYCHIDGYPNIPVFGSIGDKANAIKVCKMMNLDGKAHRHKE